MPFQTSLAAFLSVFLFAPAFAAPDLSVSLQRQIKASGLPSDAVGVEVSDLKTGAVLYSKNPSQAFNPASGIKLLIAATALSRLGPNHRFETVVARSGKNICLIGGGDPGLVHEQLVPFVDEIRRSGVSTIEGDIVVDQSLFEPSRANLEEFGGDKDRAFTAPIAPLSLDFNSLAIHLKPGKLQASPMAWLEPEVPVFQVRNRAKTVRSAGPKEIGASIEVKDGKYVVEIFGKISESLSGRTLYRALPSADLYVGQAFADRFRKEGGHFDGKVVSAKCGEPNTVLVRFASKPLSQIVFDLNKFSNNFIADMLLRTVGKDPTVTAGLAEIRSWLDEKKIGATELKMENASGLSKETRVSPHTMVEVIRAAANDFKTGAEFVSSFGIAGVDGTLRKRLKDDRSRGAVRAKSGMLSEVVSLSGLADREGYGSVAFSVIFNTAKKDTWALLSLEEEMVRTIVTGSPN